MSNRISGFAPNGYPSTSATARVLERAQLFGHAFAVDEPDTRPVADDDALDRLIDTVFSSVAPAFDDTGLESDIDALLFSLTYAFHHQVERMQRILDGNADCIRQLREEDDGSEPTTVNLEQLVDKGKMLEEKRDAFEYLRDAAKAAYSEHTGKVWTIRTGSVVNHRKMTAASIESRDYLSAKRFKETNVLVPPGTKIAFSGGYACDDVKGIWDVLDKTLAKYPDMVLFHTDGIRGADVIAKSWAASRKVTDIGFPMRKRNQADTAAPFRRNQELLATMPTGLIVFPGTGITDNLADNARNLGIIVMDRRGPVAKKGA